MTPPLRGYIQWVNADAEIGKRATKKTEVRATGALLRLRRGTEKGMRLGRGVSVPVARVSPPARGAEAPQKTPVAEISHEKQIAPGKRALQGAAAGPPKQIAGGDTRG